MSLSIFSTISNPFLQPKSCTMSSVHGPMSHGPTMARTRPRCQRKDQPGPGPMAPILIVGSPIIITEAPKMVKTAATVPCLRVNDDLVKPGDVGRIVARKPMDVWAIRLSIGTYLIDRQYFEALELEK